MSIASGKTRLKLLLGRGVRKSYSQFGEDALIQATLKNPAGTYVDVGAYHPILYSNTYALYKRGWHGLAIDPNPGMVSLHKKLRPRDTFICAAVGSEGVSAYHMFSDGAYNTLDKNEAEKRKALHHLSYKGSRDIQSKLLSTILKEQDVTAIGLLNIDVEGKDLEVLRSHEWSIRPELIAVEVEGFNPDEPQENQTYTFLRSKQYTLIGLAGLTLIFART